MAVHQDHWSERRQALADALARVALGDREAFAALYRASSAQLFGVILRISPDRAQAEDILQEVFVSIWHEAHRFDAERSQPMTWLTSIARYRAIDSRRRQKTALQTVSTSLAADDGDLLEAMPGDERGRWICCSEPHRHAGCGTASGSCRPRSNSAWLWPTTPV